MPGPTASMAPTKDLDLVLHIGLHKTATTYLQNVLSARRYDLAELGVLYPNTGTTEGPRISTRKGAQSGQSLFTDLETREGLVADLRHEIPPNASTVLISAEDFTPPRPTPEEHLEQFGMFRRIQVVVVLRRQDDWVESRYKQAVDQHLNFETRPFSDYLARVGPAHLDFHALLSPWRDLVGADSFHVLSYDDLDGGAAITRRVLEIAGVDVAKLGEFPGVEVPRYDSIRAIDTVGLRILNGYRIESSDLRNRLAQEIYATAPEGDIELLTPEMRAAVQEFCAPVNERIEAEWCTEAVPGFRFGAERTPRPVVEPTGREMVDYLDRVIALCESSRSERDDGVLS